MFNLWPFNSPTGGSRAWSSVIRRGKIWSISAMIGLYCGGRWLNGILVKVRPELGAISAYLCSLRMCSQTSFTQRLGKHRAHTADVSDGNMKRERCPPAKKGHNGTSNMITDSNYAALWTFLGTVFLHGLHLLTHYRITLRGGNCTRIDFCLISPGSVGYSP